eukprot:12195954-Alexandrium_andersonii.AAC.1
MILEPSPSAAQGTESAASAAQGMASAHQAGRLTPKLPRERTNRKQCQPEVLAKPCDASVLD